MDSHYYTAYCHQKLLNGLPNAKIKDSERLVNWVRLVKSDAEIKLMNIASQITVLGMKTAFEVINPGVRQCDAVAKIYSTLISGTKNHGGDYSSIVPSYRLVKELQLHILRGQMISLLMERLQ